MSIQQSVARCGGIARTRDLLLAHSPAEIRRGVRCGDIVRLRKGVYAIDADDPASTAARHGGSLTCISLLRAYGVWVLSDDARTHVAVGRSGREHPHEGCHCRAHYSLARPSLTRASVVDALVLAASCLSVEAFFAAYESAWNRRLLSHANRRLIRASVPASVRRLLTFARGQAESGLESLVRLRLSLLGFDVRSQVVIPSVGRVDLVIDSVIIETDGETGHADSGSRIKDLRRDRAAAILGYRTLRLSYAMVVYEWPETLRAIRAAIARA